MKGLNSGFVYLVLAAILLNCQRPVSSDPTPQANTSDYKVYSAIINQDCRYQQPTRKLYIIDPQIISPDKAISRYINDSYRTDSVSTNAAWQQFVSTVDTSQFKMTLLSQSVLSTCYQTQLLTPVQQVTYFSTGSKHSLEELRNTLLDFAAVVRFSSVVYSADELKAVSYRVTLCGFDCAWGSAYLLERKPTGWQVVQIVPIWTT